MNTPKNGVPDLNEVATPLVGAVDVTLRTLGNTYATGTASAQTRNSATGGGPRHLFFVYRNGNSTYRPWHYYYYYCVYAWGDGVGVRKGRRGARI